MRTRVQRWGHSLAVRIPKAFATEVGLTDATLVDVRVIDGQLVVVPVLPASYTLADLLDGITDANVHAEVPTDPALGGEVW